MTPLTAREKALVEKALPYAEGVVDNYLRKVPFAVRLRDDLVQAAYLATMQAVKAWRPERGASFNTYLFKYVVSRVRRAIRSDSMAGIARFPTALGFLPSTQEVESYEFEALLSETPSHEGGLEDPALYEDVRKAVLALEKRTLRGDAEKRVEAFFAVSFEGKTLLDFAKERGTTKQAVSLQKQIVQKSFDAVAATYRREG